MIFNDNIMTPRLKLRRVTEGDLALLVSWSNSELAHGKYLTPERIDTSEGLDNIVNGVYWQDRNRLFFIELKKQQPPIGTLRYWLRPGQGNSAVMAVKIADPEQRGKGYGTEAQKYMIIHLFQRVKVGSVEMYTDINNKSQQRCLAKLGFELVETLSYDDHHIKRVGHLYRIDSEAFSRFPVYRYHYEE